MPKIIRPDSALDWFTTAQLCHSAAHELLAAHPNDPRQGRIDLYREVELDGQRFMVRLKLTMVPAGAV